MAEAELADDSIYKNAEGLDQDVIAAVGGEVLQQRT